MDPECVKMEIKLSESVFFPETGFYFNVLHRTGQSSSQSVNHLPVRPMQAASFTA